MMESQPRSVKGTDPELWHQARMAALAEHQTIGAWLNQAIAEKLGRGTMARQFRLIDVRPAADGKTVTATINDGDWNRDMDLGAREAGITIVGETAEYGPRVRFATGKLVYGSLLDLDAT